MQLLDDKDQVEARFGLFGDSVIVGAIGTRFAPNIL
jgi:galactitol-specific phosphotransferase system IIC component